MPGCATCPGRMSPSTAAPPRWPATSSASGCWVSRGNTRPTAGCRSIRFGTAKAADRPALFVGECALGIAADNGHLDQGQDVIGRGPGCGYQHQTTTLRARPVAGGGQGADARRPEMGDLAEIDRQGRYAGTAFDRDLAIQGGCGGGVDVTADDDAAGLADHGEEFGVDGPWAG